MVTFVTGDRLTTQYECSTSYSLPAKASRSSDCAEYVLEFDFRPDLHRDSRQRPQGLFASVCFAAVGPASDNRAAGKPLLGVRTPGHSYTPRPYFPGILPIKPCEC